LTWRGGGTVSLEDEGTRGLGARYLVLLRAEDGGEVVGHGEVEQLRVRCELEINERVRIWDGGVREDSGVVIVLGGLILIIGSSR
jgi:hypothetical protein